MTPTLRRTQPRWPASRGSISERLRVEPALLWQLAGLAALAFLIRLIPVLLSGGLTGIIDYDDGVYMGAALALVRGKVVYRDFFMLHPPGIVYALTPFAALSWLFSDGVAFAAARLGFMAIGACNTFLVGLVASREGRSAALAAAGLYAVWIVSVKVERSTWLIAPQTALLLIALLVLTLPRSATGERPPIGWRRALVVGALIGLCGTIQIWGLIPAAVVFGWLFLRTFRQPGGWLRPMVAYTVAGLGAVAITFLPFLLAAGDKMIRIVIFDQIGRGGGGVPINARLRALEGISSAVVERLGLHNLPVVVYLVVVVAIVFVAWRRPGIRLWASLFVAQSAFLLITPSFFGHYGGWLAPAAALCIGSVFAACIEWAATERRRRVITGIYATGLACLLFVALMPRAVGMADPSRPFDARGVAELIKAARCPTSDSPTVLIVTGAMRRVLDGGCPLLVSPTGVSYDTDRDLRGKARTRPNQPEYQAVMAAYYGGSDAAMFSRKPSNNGLSDETWAVIRGRLPVERHHDKVMVLLPAGS